MWSRRACVAEEEQLWVCLKRASSKHERKRDRKKESL
jgi:hypothetical protein